MVENAVAALVGLTDQTKANNLTVQLQEALIAFEAKAYQGIPADAILMTLGFEEGKGTTVATAGNKKWTAVLTAGPKTIFPDTDVPTFVDGVKGKALHFTKGSHLEISGVTAKDFELSKMSIATWIKLDAARTNNFICSFNWWNTVKASIQEAGKPFVTIKTTTSCVDMDNEHDASVTPETGWTHVAFVWDGTKGTMDIYVNGELTKAWDKGDALKGNLAFPDKIQPFIIGQIAPNAELTDSENDWSWCGTNETWGSLYGSLDEFSIYNIALTAGQVAKLAK